MIHNSDWLKNDIPDKSINLIIADPPYFEVKGDFDFIWPDFESYLQDVEKWAVECKRVLANNGCLFWWGHAKKIAYSQVILDKYFKLENHLKWEKDVFWGLEYRGKSRAFAPITEHCLFYSNEIVKTGLQEIYDTPDCFKTIKKYMRDEREKVMIHNNFKKVEDFNKYIRKITNTAAVVDRHYFADSQYEFPTAGIYAKLQTTSFFQRPYEELRNEYEKLRRPFFGELYDFTDVIKASQEAHANKIYDHDTVKPLTLTKKLIQTTSREGDTVLIPFGGSGTEVEACISTGRKYICFEIDEKYYDMIIQREKIKLAQGELFLGQQI